ncbi:MAG: hypothetical protein ACRYG8_45640, partial [Janthinobacterium lividum]
LELANYRPYEIEDEDCKFINKTLSQALRHMDLDDRKLCIRMLSGTSARLIFKGKFAAGTHLTPPSLYPHLVARVAMRALLPKSLKRFVQQKLGRGEAFIK